MKYKLLNFWFLKFGLILPSSTVSFLEQNLNQFKNTCETFTKYSIIIYKMDNFEVDPSLLAESTASEEHEETIFEPVSIIIF